MHIASHMYVRFASAIHVPTHIPTTIPIKIHIANLIRVLIDRSMDNLSSIAINIYSNDLIPLPIYRPIGIPILFTSLLPLTLPSERHTFLPPSLPWLPASFHIYFIQPLLPSLLPFARSHLLPSVLDSSFTYLSTSSTISFRV